MTLETKDVTHVPGGYGPFGINIGCNENLLGSKCLDAGNRAMERAQWDQACQIGGALNLVLNRRDLNPKCHFPKNAGAQPRPRRAVVPCPPPSARVLSGT